MEEYNVPERAQCLWCKKEFDVLRYGRRIPCPHCKKRLDIFPDPLLQVDTNWGSFTISILQPSFVEEMKEEVKKVVKDSLKESLSPVEILRKVLGR